MTRSPVPDEGVRLAKRVAEMRHCSRREAEKYIEGGWVRVNGQLVEEPQFRVLDQSIEIDSSASLLDLKPVTLLLHKPEDSANPLALIGPRSHFKGDPSNERCLKRHFSNLTVPIALENAASGLLVFTQDWRVTRKLTEDAQLLEQEYLVDIDGDLSADALTRISQPGIKVSLNSTGPGVTRLRFAIKGWQPGQIARWCEIKAFRILAMKRLRIGRVAMSQLPVGQWRYLQDLERF